MQAKIFAHPCIILPQLSTVAYSLILFSPVNKYCIYFVVPGFCNYKEGQLRHSVYLFFTNAYVKSICIIVLYW